MTAISSATATAPAERGRVQIPAPPEPMPAALYGELLARATSNIRCTSTIIGSSTVTAAHCLGSNPTGWTISGDRAWKGPEPDWAGAIPRGATLYAVGYPASAHGQPVAYTLAALDPRTVTMSAGPTMVLMALGDGTPCTPGASGMMAWVTVDNVARPVGPMSVYSIDPAVTGLPAGQYVCGFAR